MPTGPQRPNPYPAVGEAGGTGWAGVHAAHGAGDHAAIFKGAPKIPSPWPSAGRQKGQRNYDPERVTAAMKDPSAHVRDMDPRNLHASQPSITAEGTSYYMKDDYRKTGRTFADMDVATNRLPIVYTDTRGRNQILSGHHRATAALLRGEQFRTINIQE